MITPVTNHTFFDHVLFALLLFLPVFEWKWSWPRYLARLAADPHNARGSHYRRLLIGEWIPTLAMLVVWAALHRPWSALRLTGDTPLRLLFGVACVLALIVLLVSQRRALLRRPDRHDRIRKALAYGEPLLPHTEPERRLFWAVSATAGICEEIIFRGFLTWYFLAWMGPVSAVILASLLFGIGPRLSRGRAGSQDCTDRASPRDRRQPHWIAVARHAPPRGRRLELGRTWVSTARRS